MVYPVINSVNSNSQFSKSKIEIVPNWEFEGSRVCFTSSFRYGKTA